MGAIVVTGCSGGIGKSICQQLIRMGYDVIGIDKVSPEKQILSRKKFHFVKMSLSESTKKSFVEVEEKVNKFRGKVDGLVHVAGVQIEKALMESSFENWDEILNVNVKSAWVLTKIILPNLSKSSSIVFIGSVHARVTSTNLSFYSLSKHALEGLMKTLSIELAPLGVRVNIVAPGAVETPMLLKNMKKRGQGALSRLIQRTPTRSLCSVDEVARMTSFLLDKENHNITGHTFFVDGGVLCLLATEV